MKTGLKAIDKIFKLLGTIIKDVKKLEQIQNILIKENNLTTEFLELSQKPEPIKIENKKINDVMYI